MGTGSHRPQWEAAKGRPDVLGGIRHARALKSHTKLKYRSAQAHPGANALSLPTVDSRVSAKNPETKADTDTKSITLEPNEHEDDHVQVSSEPQLQPNAEPEFESDSESDTDAMQRELDQLTKRNTLRAQLLKSRNSKWRSESTFSKPRPKTKKSPNSGFLDKYVR